MKATIGFWSAPLFNATTIATACFAALHVASVHAAPLEIFREAGRIVRYAHDTSQGAGCGAGRLAALVRLDEALQSVGGIDAFATVREWTPAEFAGGSSQRLDKRITIDTQGVYDYVGLFGLHIPTGSPLTLRSAIASHFMSMRTPVEIIEGPTPVRYSELRAALERSASKLPGREAREIALGETGGFLSGIAQDGELGNPLNLQRIHFTAQAHGRTNHHTVYILPVRSGAEGQNYVVIDTQGPPERLFPELN